MKREIEQYLKPYAQDIENTSFIYNMANTYNNTFLSGVALYFIVVHMKVKIKHKLKGL